MTKINILDFEIESTYGDLKSTLDVIKNGQESSSKKDITIEKEIKTIPFFSFKDIVKQNQKDIYEALKNLVNKIVQNIEDEKRENTALIIGTSLIDWHLVDAVNDSAYEYKRKEYESSKYSIDSYAKKLSEEFGLNEFTMTINTACTSSANALLEARNLIDANIVDSVIVVGLEVFSPVMSSGFYSMELISNNKIKPFDTNRDGLILGEAICAIVLGKDNSSWSLEGGFSNCNSQSITSVSQSGDECVEVMNQALKNCNLQAKDITALKAHATGSQSNDLAEINAINKVFDSSITFTALKPYFGHTIGASGILEMAVLMACLNDGFIPKTLNCEESILKSYTPIKEHNKCNDGIFMCNYFGFGGNNTSLIIKKEQQ